MVVYSTGERLTSFIDGSPLIAYAFSIPDTGYTGTLYVDDFGRSYIHWDFEDHLVYTEAFVIETLARDVINATARGMVA